MNNKQIDMLISIRTNIENKTKALKAIEDHTYSIDNNYNQRRCLTINNGNSIESCLSNDEIKIILLNMKEVVINSRDILQKEFDSYVVSKRLED